MKLNLMGLCSSEQFGPNVADLPVLSQLCRAGMGSPVPSLQPSFLQFEGCKVLGDAWAGISRVSSQAPSGSAAPRPRCRHG